MYRTVHSSLVRGVLAGSLLACAVASPARAQSAVQGLGYASLEELMDIRVTSAARKSQRAEDVASAIFVITQEDIRRSGYATLPEVLRLAPGVQVAQVSASRWAVSMRGFNDLYANKLLVLVDGRSIYTRTFSGVLWDMQDVVLSDIERIEVIRGPGGASWGANAVNGVINIITRSAADTPGLSLEASTGSFLRERGALRYGGNAGRMAYRVYGQWTGWADSAPASLSFSDRWQSLTTGFRTDWARGSDVLLTQGHVTGNNTRPGWVELTSLVPGTPSSVDGEARAAEASLLSRWTRTRADGTILQVQGYHTTTRRTEPILRFTERTSDVDAQYETRLGVRHGVMVGGGYRHVDLSTSGTLTMGLGGGSIGTVNAFVQDEVDLGRDVALTLGTKLEHDTIGGWGVLPSARVLWDASRTQRVWAGVSRARRTPSFADRSLHLVLGTDTSSPVPVVLRAAGSEAFDSEHLLQAEAGYRTRVGSAISVDTTVFTGAYRDVRTYERQEPTLDLSYGVPLVLLSVAPDNLARARASGLEVAGNWTPSPFWRVDGNYTYMHLTSQRDPRSTDATVETLSALAPAHQWQVRTDVQPVSRVRLGTSLIRTGVLRQFGLPAHSRVDGRAEVTLSRGTTISLVGQNLVNARHREYASDMYFMASTMPRSVRVDLRWQF